MISFKQLRYVPRRALRRFWSVKRNRRLTPIFIAIILVASFGAYEEATGYVSPDHTKDRAEIEQTVWIGWQIKHVASVKANQSKVDQLREMLPNFYSNEKGELSVQQRIISAELDTSVIKGVEPSIAEKNYEDPNQYISAFRANNLDVIDLNINGDKATVKGKVDYFQVRHTLAMDYRQPISNTFTWELTKKNNKWLITKESLDASDDDKSYTQ